jgi:hypothetical protein
MTATETSSSTKPSRSRPDTSLVGTVTANVLKALGTPPGYIKTKACNVFDNRWRVDVWVQVDDGVPRAITKASISDSFFLQVDVDGNIIGQIEKKY